MAITTNQGQDKELVNGGKGLSGFDDLLQTFANAKIIKINSDNNNVVGIFYELNGVKSHLFTTQCILLAAINTVMPLFKNPFPEEPLS